MMYADKDSQLIYESYINEGFTLRGEEWPGIFAKWKNLVAKWPTEEIQPHNKHIIKIIQDEANKREQRGEFGKVTGPDITIYYSPVQKMDIGSGQEKGPSGVSVVEQFIDGEFRAYMIPDADVDTVRAFWQKHTPHNIDQLN